MIPEYGKLYEVTKDIVFMGSSSWGTSFPVDENPNILLPSVQGRTFVIPQGTILLCGRVTNYKYHNVPLKICKKYNPNFKKLHPSLQIDFNSGHASVTDYNKFIDGNLRELTQQEIDDANKMAR